MKIIIGADLVPTESNKEKFKQEKFIDFFENQLKEKWLNSDFRIFNLECPLGENLKPISKSGPNLIADSQTIKGIKSLNPSIILLSNNHILDYGQEGLNNTINLLSQNNITYTGIINSNKDKLKELYLEKDNLKIGIYNLCENEFSVATLNSKGANPLNEIKNYKEIANLKQKCDYVIVIFHGGKEYYRYPSPKLQELCRNFIDFGANIVITQHSHCIGSLEEYNNGKILYGQGNFIFDGGNDEFWNSALLLEIEITKDKINLNYIPIEKENGLIKISENENIIQDFYERNEQIKDEDFIEEYYKRFANSKLNGYLNIMNKVRFYKKIFNRVFNRKFFLKTYNKVDCLRILNIIECEAHRELLIKGLKEKIK